MKNLFWGVLALSVGLRLPAATVAGAAAGPLHTLTIDLTSLSLDSTTVGNIQTQCWQGTGYANGAVTGILKPLKIQSVDVLTTSAITVRVGTDAGAQTNVTCSVTGGASSSGPAGTPGGTSGQVQYNNAGSLAGFTVGGDGTLNASTGALAVTKTNGVSFAPSATTDTTNASNISSGTLTSGRLPASIAANTTGTAANVTGTVSLANGGTGQTTAPAAISALMSASKSRIQEVNGDLWITANAYYDGTNWQRFDTTKTAFGLQMQGTNNIPGGEVTPGTNLWVVQPGTNPINTTYGSVGGWDLAQVLTGDRQMVIGGAGMEIDGYGSVPYARVMHNTISSTLYTGFVRNLFPDFSGVDSNTDPSWFAGLVGDAFKVQRAVAGSTSLSDLLTISATGDLTVPRVATLVNTVTFSTTPAFNLSLGDFQKITLTGNVSSSTTSNVKAGQRVVLQICQDATGSRTFVYPTTMKGGQTIGATASKCSTQEFASFDGVNLYAVAAGTTNQ